VSGIPPGAELFAHNRVILAERLHWPDGAVGDCEKIDRMHPGWHTSWRREFGDKPAGFYAFHDNHSWMEDHLYGKTPGELWVAIETHRCPHRTGF
jgi:hypothetical protein